MEIKEIKKLFLKFQIGNAMKNNRNEKLPC